MFPALALGALSFGGSLLQGIGQKQAAGKQARMQLIADTMAREANERTLAEVNARREALGRELMTVPETQTVENNSWQTTTGGVDLAGFMRAGEQAGFNPVTWLNSGALSLFGTTYTQNGGEVTTTYTGHNAADAFKLMAPEYTLAQASQVPQQHSMLSAFGGALSAGANAFGTQYRADQSYDLQMSKLALGLSNSFGGGGGNTSGISYGTKVTGGGAASGSGSMSSASWPSVNSWGGMNLPKGVDVKEPEMTPLGMFGWKQDPRFPMGQTVEDLYTEVGSWPYGVFKMANDISLNQFGVAAPGNIVLGLAPSGASRSATEKAYVKELTDRGFMIPGGWWNQWFGTAQ